MPFVPGPLKALWLYAQAFVAFRIQRVSRRRSGRHLGRELRDLGRSSASGDLGALGF